MLGLGVLDKISNLLKFSGKIGTSLAFNFRIQKSLLKIIFECYIFVSEPIFIFLQFPRTIEAKERRVLLFHNTHLVKDRSVVHNRPTSTFLPI